MMGRMQYRLECMKLANALACSKNIPAKDVIPTAMEYYKWIDDDPNEEVDLSALKRVYSKSNDSGWSA